MDNTDKLLITLLKENSRFSYKQLSQKVHLSQLAVKERIEKLLDTNVISKFTIETGYLKNQISAFIHIKTSQCIELEKILSSLKNIKNIYRMAGYYNYCAEIQCESHNHLLDIQKSLRPFGPSQLHIITERL
ncbi:AsnC family transcriptional regulator [Staphylococcus xylosus]|uniref:Lrp/AsnC family transcriptional regulator n=1 Tax=Staphylococcus xylosus TaxID=1288 RepID=UPI002DBD64F5|nr:AsnC family transcriptional regulator [Staphylococcus xylosus]MEB6320895.1 AsnC family transcriptional regulator [Staphylococcus xylosus]